MSKLLRNAIYLFILLIYSPFCAAVDVHTGNWDTAEFFGSFSEDKKVKYYIQPQVQFIDRENKYQLSYLYLGVGYQFSHDFIFWLMDGEYNTKQPKSNVDQVNAIRQQLDWATWRTNPLRLIQGGVSSTTRLEELKKSNSTQWEIRLREKVLCRVPLKKWEHHSFVVSNEAFFDFTYPKWTNSNDFLQQNQFFVGMGTVINKSVAFDLGYLNQYQWNHTRLMDNVIYLVFFIDLDNIKGK